MADLTTTIIESVVLNGALRGNTNVVTTSGINNVFERILTCSHSNVTTVAVFAASPHTSAGAIDLDRTKYIRITNLDAAAVMDIAIVTTSTNYQVVITPGNSHILCQADTTAIGDDSGGAPAFGTLQNITSIQVKPRGSADVQVSMFVALT
tara:strand:+ start:383 stop:835 length:453 start_codon:yes stop_codon:yes gene_type:complete